MFRLFGMFNRRTTRIISVILALVAVGMFAGSIAATVSDLNLRAHGVTTNAVVTGVSTHFSRKSADRYTDRIEFSTPDGTKHDASISGSRGDRVGETVAVVYDPSDPGTVQPKSSLTGVWWLGPVVLLLFALLFGWLGRRLWRRASRIIPMKTAQNAFG